MKYRILGKTGLKVSVVGVGAWQFGGEWGRDFSQDEVDAILDRARDEGINLIDTAECYGPHLSEELVGRAIARDREKWVVATKFGHRFKGHLERDDLYGAEDVRIQLEDSLKALGTDYIDLYQFHSGDDEAFHSEGLWEMLRAQVEQGKIRQLGLSIRPVEKAMNQVREASEVGAGAIQMIYNRLEREPEKEGLPECRRRNLGVVARVPLASGLLSGKYRPGDRFDNEQDVRSRRDGEAVRATLEEVERIRREEVPEGADMAAWALAWCLKHPAVTCVIPGCKSPEQVSSNASAAGFDMVSEDHPQAAG